ncbi:myb-like protein X isoform X2 [Ylistrum balloti]|uniref:myb-like protein X isoform X2 n=1 Tax=Ylistrum balloti TaxID=509963 RepID=UPI002905BCFA|nr:myb-like protein X isoform X2 [Ylistrum balloti]
MGKAISSCKEKITSFHSSKKAQQSDILEKEKQEKAKQSDILVKDRQENAEKSDNSVEKQNVWQSDISQSEKQEKAKQSGISKEEKQGKAKQSDILVKDRQEIAKKSSISVEKQEKVCQSDILEKEKKDNARQSHGLEKEKQYEAKQSDNSIKETTEIVQQYDVLCKNLKEKRELCDIPQHKTLETAKQNVHLVYTPQEKKKEDDNVDKSSQEKVEESEVQDELKQTKLDNKQDTTRQKELEQHKLLPAKEENWLIKAEQTENLVDHHDKGVNDEFTKKTDIALKTGDDIQTYDMEGGSFDDDAGSFIEKKDLTKKRQEMEGHRKVHNGDAVLSEDVVEDEKSKMETASTGVDNSVAALESKQTAILQRLGELKGVLEQLNKKYGSATTVSSSTTSSTMILPGGVVHDIVINADPENPPVIVFVLFTLLKERCRVYGSSLVHSSVVSVPDQLRNVFSDQDNNCPRGSHQVAITLIWKKVENGPNLIVSPHNQTTIQGEVNIARYIMRLINQNYDNSDPVASTQIDEWLDSAQQQLHHGNVKQKAAAVKSLNARLGRNDWLVGSEMSLADMVMWAALFQTNQMSNAPNNVKKWLASCDKNSVYQFAKTVLNGR